MTAPWHARQLELLDDPIDASFRSFHHTYPEVYESLVGMARMWRTAGHGKCGMKMLFELIRWEHGLNVVDDDGFRLNNNYASRYARLIMANEPDLDGFFDTRVLHTTGALVA